MSNNSRNELKLTPEAEEAILCAMEMRAELTDKQLSRKYAVGVKTLYNAAHRAEARRMQGTYKFDINGQFLLF